MGAGAGKNRRVQNKRTPLGRRKTAKTWTQYDALPPRARLAWERKDTDYAEAADLIKDERLRTKHPIDAGALMTEAAMMGGVGWDYQ